MSELCVLPGPNVNSCYTGCDQCPYTQQAWGMLPFDAFAGLTPVVLVAVQDCVWSGDCVKDCDQCPHGTVAAWFVQVTQCDFPITSAVLVPQGRCRWSSCCPEGQEVLPV